MTNKSTAKNILTLISLVAIFSIIANAQGANDNVDMNIPSNRPVEEVTSSELVKYEAAGQMSVPYDRTKVAQGWLVGECLVVAPRHSIFPNGSVDKKIPSTYFDFKVGYQGKNQFKENVKIKPIFCGRGNNGDSTAEEDYCVFKTNRSLANRVEPIILKDADFNHSTNSLETTIGFFPQMSKALDTLAKDVNAEIITLNDGRYNVRTAVISGAGLTRYNADAKETYLIGMQVSDTFAVDAKTILDAGEKYEKTHKNGLSCD